MTRILSILVGSLLAFGAAGAEDESNVRFQGMSPYHNIQVVDKKGFRILSFDGTTESRISLTNALEGHFEYTEYFHMAWLWNREITNVLLIGLGGGTVQRSFEHYYPQWRLETAEIDPLVRQVALEFFSFTESPSQQIRLEDGRVYLRRARTPYDYIILDAYTKGRYGSAIPYHLATKEFFELANERLSTNGVIAYNVIGTMSGWQTDILGAVYKTMKSVFPQVYFFPARGSYNTVLVGTKSPASVNMVELRKRADDLMRSKEVTLPTFRTRFQVLRLQPAPGFYQSRVLTDDFAPVDGLLSRGR